MKETGNSSLIARYALPPRTIEERSFTIIDGLLPSLPGSPQERQVVRRIVHTTGDPTLAEQIRLHPGATAAGVAALRAGHNIITDVRMVAAGINARLAGRLGCAIRCAIDAPEVLEHAQSQGTTRAAAAMRWLALPSGDHDGGPPLDGGIVAIGNAPTALLALLDLVDASAVRPALIVGVPVGFVAAAEAKEELMRRDVPYITLPGTRGGSTVAVATVNALLLLACSPDTTVRR